MVPVHHPNGISYHSTASLLQPHWATYHSHTDSTFVPFTEVIFSLLCFLFIHSTWEWWVKSITAPLPHHQTVKNLRKGTMSLVSSQLGKLPDSYLGFKKCFVYWKRMSYWRCRREIRLVSYSQGIGIYNEGLGHRNQWILWKEVSWVMVASTFSPPTHLFTSRSLGFVSTSLPLLLSGRSLLEC